MVTGVAVHEHFSCADWSSGNRSQRPPVHSCRVLHHQEGQGDWRDYPHSKSQPWRTRWRLWNQVQCVQWRLGLWKFVCFLINPGASYLDVNSMGLRLILNKKKGFIGQEMKAS